MVGGGERRDGRRKVEEGWLLMEIREEEKWKKRGGWKGKGVEEDRS